MNDDQPKDAGATPAMTDVEIVERGLAFVAEFKGDQHAFLNCFYSEALAAEVIRLRALAPSPAPAPDASAAACECELYEVCPVCDPVTHAALTQKAAPDASAAALIERLQSRIHALMNRGSKVCVEFQPPVDGYPGCNRCGYQRDVHLVRDAAAALAQRDRQLEQLRKERLGYTLEADRLLGESLDLRSSLRAMREALEWQPIATAPKDGGDLLLFIPSYGVGIGSWLTMSKAWCYSDRYDDPPTHWMSLPAKPAALAGSAGGSGSA